MTALEHAQAELALANREVADTAQALAEAEELNKELHLAFKAALARLDAAVHRLEVVRWT